MAQRPEIMLEAARRLQNETALRFMFVGDGVKRDELLEQASGLTNVTFVENQPVRRVISFLQAADALLVNLSEQPGFETTIPSKLFHAMAVERPVVAGVQGDAKDIVEASGCGITYSPSQVDGLVTAIQTLKENPAVAEQMGRNGREAVYKRFHRRTLADRLEQIVSDIGARER